MWTAGYIASLRRTAKIQIGRASGAESLSLPAHPAGRSSRKKVIQIFYHAMIRMVKTNFKRSRGIFSLCLPGSMPQSVLIPFMSSPTIRNTVIHAGETQRRRKLSVTVCDTVPQSPIIIGAITGGESGRDPEQAQHYDHKYDFHGSTPPCSNSSCARLHTASKALSHDTLSPLATWVNAARVSWVPGRSTKRDPSCGS
jgi:hypothetical protein